MSAAKAGKRFSSAWRLAGLNYLENINAATGALRAVLKEPMRTEVLGRTAFSFREFRYVGGAEQPAEFVSTHADDKRKR